MSTSTRQLRGDLLRVRDLRVTFFGRAGEVRAVDGAELTVAGGQTVAVVGESGSGKSTLARAVLGLLPRAAQVLAGELRFAGRSLLPVGADSVRELRGRRIGFIPQDPMVSLNPVVPIGVQVAEPLRIHRLAGRGELRDRAVELLRAAGLPEAAARARQYPHELSSGMRQRVLIAIALAGQPELLIADEPTSALDAVAGAWILDHLAGLTERPGTSVILITHDLGIVADRADQMVVMDRGRVVEAGPTRRLLGDPQHPATQLLVASSPRLNSARLWPVPPVPPGHRATSGNGRAPAPVAATTDPGGELVRVKGLTKVFHSGSRRHRRETRALDGVSFSVRRGETLAVVGESGAGKSTLARLLLRLSEPTAGQILFDRTDLVALRGRALRAYRHRVQLIFQDPYASLDPQFTASELIMEPLRAFGWGDRASCRARMHEVAEQVALPAALLDRRPGELSGGQCQRVAIARAIAPGPDLLVCDEPTASLDVSVQAQIVRLLVQLQSELGLSLVFIAHDLSVVRLLADRVAVMRAGRIVEQGTADQVFAAPAHPYTGLLLSSRPGWRDSEPARGDVLEHFGLPDH